MEVLYELNTLMNCDCGCYYTCYTLSVREWVCDHKKKGRVKEVEETGGRLLCF